MLPLVSVMKNSAFKGNSLYVVSQHLIKSFYFIFFSLGNALSFYLLLPCPYSLFLISLFGEKKQTNAYSRAYIVIFLSSVVLVCFKKRK